MSDIFDYKKRVADVVHANVADSMNSYATCKLMAELHIAAGEKRESDLKQQTWNYHIDYLRKVLWATVPKSAEADYINQVFEIENTLRESKNG